MKKIHILKKLAEQHAHESHIHIQKVKHALLECREQKQDLESTLQREMNVAQTDPKLAVGLDRFILKTHQAKERLEQKEYELIQDLEQTYQQLQNHFQDFKKYEKVESEHTQSLKRQQQQNEYKQQDEIMLQKNHRKT